MEHKIQSKVLAVVLALMMILGQGVTAFAQTNVYAKKDNYIKIWGGEHISYGSGMAHYTNTKISSYGDNKEKVAICIEPEKPTPDSATYTYDYLSTSNYQERLLRKILYYAPNYPGANEGIKLANGIQNSSQRLAAYHLALSMVFKNTTDLIGWGGGSVENGCNKTVWNAALNIYNKAKTSSVPEPPDSFMAIWFGGGQWGQRMVYGWQKPQGYVQVQKVGKGEQELVKKCPEQYTLEGAVFWLYDTEANAKAGGDAGYIDRLVTDSTGNSNVSKPLSPGTYWVVEGHAPRGYVLNKTPQQVTVTSNETSKIQIADVPALDPLHWGLVSKTIKEGTDKNLSVEGAEFTVKYYNTLGSIKDKTPTQTWTFLADKNGRVKWQDSYLKKGSDKLWKDKDGDSTGLIGTYTIEETNAPKGLAKDDKVVTVTIKQAGEGLKKTIATYEPGTEFESAVAEDGTAWKQVENPQEIELQIQKVDSETGEAKPQGYGSLEGAKYSISYFDPYEAKDVFIGEVTTDENGKAVMTNLKPGLYKITEISASAGYLVEGITHEVYARIKEKNTPLFAYETISLETPTDSQVKKISFDKDGKEMFVVGATLQLINSDGKILETWESSAEPKEFKALPIGEYTIKEINTPTAYLPPERDYKFTVQAVKDIQIYDVFNEPVPTIKTEALFSTGAKSSTLNGKLKVIDTIEYERVMVGHPYEFKGKLLDKNNPKRVIAEGNVKFTPDKASGKTQVEYTFDSSELKNAKEDGLLMVVTEELYRLDRTGNKLVAEHKDLTDQKQTVSIPTIHTTAQDKVDKGKDIFASKKQTPIDIVKYTNLFTDREYTVTGTLMNQATGKPILIDGKEVKSTKTFKPTSPNGTVTIEFNDIDLSALAGKSIVTFEDMKEKDITVAVHADINDKGQTLDIPEIGTTLVSQEDFTKHVLPLDKVTVKDTVQYKKLLDGKYIMKGSIVDETGKVLGVAEKVFTVGEKDNSENSVELQFTINAKDLKGQKIVAFEELYKYDNDKQGKIVAEHKDINDKGQTVEVLKPELKTTATVNGGKTAVTTENVTIVDKVHYSNLIPNKEYTLQGKLMDKATGKPYLVNGKEVTSTIQIKPEKSEGVAEMKFTFNGSKITKETQLVVFENLSFEGQELAVHADINDKGQTVTITPQPQTGDTTDTTLPLTMMAIAGVSMLGLVGKRRKDNGR